MRITPLDIRKQVFAKKMFGYDVYEVKSFMEMIASELEQVNREVHEFTEKIKTIESELGTYKNIEKNMQDTLMTAQKITDEIKVNAQKEAELIVKDAQIHAHKEKEIAREKVLNYEKELTTLKHQKEVFVSRFRSMVKTQLEMLSILEKDENESILKEESLNVNTDVASEEPEVLDNQVSQVQSEDKDNL